VIRPATLDDIPAILALAVSSGLFPPGGTDEVADVLRASLAGELGPDHCWATDDDGGPVGVAYYAPERMTEGTWNLYMIAVDRSRQRQGRGAALVRHVEEALAARGARLLLVETSGVPEFEPTRDFYRDGEDKIVFRKPLAPRPAWPRASVTAAACALAGLPARCRIG